MSSLRRQESIRTAFLLSQGGEFAFVLLSLANELKVGSVATPLCSVRDDTQQPRHCKHKLANIKASSCVEDLSQRCWG